jgi:hypothetical protein
MRIISIYLLLFVAQNAFAALPPTYRDGQMSFSVNTDYFSTTANYDRFGNKIALPYGWKYENITTSIDAQFDLPENFVIGGGLGMASATSHGEDLIIPLPYTKTRTNSEITNAHAFAQYFIDYERFRLVPELRAVASFKQINLYDFTNDSVLTNDYADSVTAGSWAIVNFGQLRAFGYLGFMYQDDGRASEMPWQAGVLWRSRHFLVSGAFDGYQPVINDKYTSFVNGVYPRENRTFYVDGNSFRYYATNPALTEIRLTGGYAFENNLQVTAGFGQTLMGTETAQGISIFAGVSFGVDMAAGPNSSFEHKKPRRPTPANPDEPQDMKRTPRLKNKEGDFQPTLEQYDESLFD